ncbi:hypothetical protein [Streptomyces sp. KL2]|uniref:hypothetical protein n=1 Tax=Streptomyces sp. KL2 TaxID=3050126 RepID=UPI0039784A7B
MPASDLPPPSPPPRESVAPAYGPPAAALARWRTAASATVLTVAAFGAAVYGVVWLHGSGPP